MVTQVVLLVAHGIDQRLWEEHGGSSGASISRLLLGPAVVQARNATLVPGQRSKHAICFRCFFFFFTCDTATPCSIKTHSTFFSSLQRKQRTRC